MSLYEQWKELIDNQTEDSFPDFWEEYSDAETRIYNRLLDNPNETVIGSFGDLTEKYGVKPVLFMGFLDGINTSLRKENDIVAYDENSQVELDIDLEALYFNMQLAGADYLFTLSQWESILSEEKRAEITKKYKQSKTVVRNDKVGRNDPCPCGSGKKYKKCCGK